MNTSLPLEKSKPSKIACFFKYDLLSSSDNNEIFKKYSILFPRLTDFKIITSLNIDLLLIEYSFFIENDLSKFISLLRKNKNIQIFFLIRKDVSINSEFLFHDFIDRIILLDSNKINLVNIINDTSNQQIKKGKGIIENSNHNWLNNEVKKIKEKDSRLLEKINNAIDHNCEKGEISIAILAKTLITPRMYLVHEINRITGLTATSYILNYRLAIAKTFLDTTNYRVKEISNKLCFFNASYFTKRFKKLYGISPTNYRKKQNK